MYTNGFGFTEPSSGDTVLVNVTREKMILWKNLGTVLYAIFPYSKNKFVPTYTITKQKLPQLSDTFRIYR